jgi:hypothetical protein
MEERFVKQVELLLRVAPEISKIEEFALHGGTAINLFYHNMPRLSVDIDLTYVPFENRTNDLRNISLLLKKLSERLRKTIPAIQIHFKNTDNIEEKLFCRLQNNEIKIEVNTINRGIIDILSVAKGEPEWLYEDWSKFPGIAWKLKNIEILKKKNPGKFKTQINNLENILA